MTSTTLIVVNYGRWTRGRGAGRRCFGLVVWSVSNNFLPTFFCLRFLMEFEMIFEQVYLVPYLPRLPMPQSGLGRGPQTIPSAFSVQTINKRGHTRERHTLQGYHFPGLYCLIICDERAMNTWPGVFCYSLISH